MSFKEIKIESQTIYKGKILTLNKDKVLLDNGETSFREEILHNGGVGVLCVKNNKVLLVKQFRYAYGKELLEIPAGKLEKGEDPMKAGIRELEEETGIITTKLTLLNTLYPTPGYTNEIIYVYLCDEIIDQTNQRLDEDEFVSYEWVDINLLVEKIKNKEIHDAKTVFAILAYISKIYG